MTPTPMPPPLNLDPELIDDLLYSARIGDWQMLQELLAEASQKYPDFGAVPLQEILAAVVDPETGNTVLHMAAANDHTVFLNSVLRIFTPAPSTSVTDSTPALTFDSTSTSTSPPSPSTFNPCLPRINNNPPVPLPPLLHTLLSTPNSAGNTALHWAALRGNEDCVKSLVHAGADLSLKNHAGRTPLSEAHFADQEGVATWLMVVEAERDGGKGDVEQTVEKVAGLQIEEGGDGVAGKKEEHDAGPLDETMVNGKN